MADAPGLTLYQAEWCPFSSAVREVLTELGIDVALRQVEPWSEERQALKQLTGTDQIPVLRDADGRFHHGTREIFAYLRERELSRLSAAHRGRFAEHRGTCGTTLTGQLIEHFRTADELEHRESSRRSRTRRGNSKEASSVGHADR